MNNKSEILQFFLHILFCSYVSTGISNVFLSLQPVQPVLVISVADAQIVTNSCNEVLMYNTWYSTTFSVCCMSNPLAQLSI